MPTTTRRMSASAALLRAAAGVALIRAAGAADSDNTSTDSLAVSLTSENFAGATEGKTVFVKFFAPWCEHCKALAPAWDALASDWVDHPVGLVGEVDCTSQRSLCESHGIEGLPTLLYGDPSSGQPMGQYADEKDVESLKAFATKVLVPVCSPANLAACDDRTRADMERFMSMSEGEIERLIGVEEGKLTEAEEEFDRGYREMQEQYDALSLAKEMNVAKVKEKIRTMKAVRTSRS